MKWVPLIAMTALIMSSGALPIIKDGQCPSSYVQSGAYCTPGLASAPVAILKRGQCPSGWSQSGNYCVAPPGVRP